MTSPTTNRATAAYSGASGPDRSLQAPTATIPMTLVASVPGEGDRVERVAVEVGAHDRHHRRDRERLHRREEDQRDRADRHPDVARSPRCSPLRTRAGVSGEGRRAGHGETSAPMRATASRSTSGEQPKLMRTCPLPSSPNSGPRCSATFASRRILTRGLSPQPSTPRGRPTRGSRHPGCDSARPGRARRAARRAGGGSRRARRAGHRATRRSPARTRRRSARAPNRPVRHSTSSGRDAHAPARCVGPPATISAHFRPARL